MLVNQIDEQTSGEPDFFDDGYLRIEYKNFYAACDGQLLKIPRTEFLLLSRLAQSPNRIVSHEELWNSIWGGSKSLNTESLKVHIYRLRRIFNPYKIHFETLVNVGYAISLDHRS